MQAFRRVVAPLSRSTGIKNTPHSTAGVVSAPVPELSKADHDPDAQRVHVMKFGGSSVGSGEAMKRVAGILMDKQQTSKPVGVLSAMYGITNHLVGATTAAETGKMSDVRLSRDTITQLHKTAADDMAMSAARKSECMDYIEESLSTHFDSACERVAEQKESTPEDHDLVWSLGERFTNKMVSAYIRDQGVESEMFEGDKIVVTTDVSGGAEPLLDETRANAQLLVKPVLENGGTALVTGYFGASEQGKITTLGRGGSDLSAAVLGYCLDAEQVELFKVECSTNEDGWLDEWQPGWEGIVHDGNVKETIVALSYEEAAELAHFGKKVLHPATVFPAVKASIPIAVKNTLNSEHPGTMVVSADETPVETTPQDILAQMGLASDSCRPTTITKVDVTKYCDMHKTNLPLPAGLEAQDATLVAVVGVGVSDSSATRAAVTDLLEKSGISISVPDIVNGSEHNFSFICHSSEAKTAVKMLYNELVVKPAQAAAESANMDVLAGEAVSQSKQTAQTASR